MFTLEIYLFVRRIYLVTKKGTPVKKTKDVKIAANVMADLIKTEEKAKAEVKTMITIHIKRP